MRCMILHISHKRKILGEENVGRGNFRRVKAKEGTICGEEDVRRCKYEEENVRRGNAKGGTQYIKRRGKC